jgi:hypothetical protein
MKTYSTYSLKTLLEDLRRDGVQKEDFQYINFQLSYDDCYYESDPPSIRAIFYDEDAKRNKKN